MTEQTRTSPPASTTGSRPKPFWLIAVVAVILGIVIWRLAFAMPKVSDNVVVLSGRIEGDDSAIAPKTSGRIAEIRFREGDSAKAGDTIAVLDDEQVRAREDQAAAALAVSEARQRAATSQLAALQAQLEQTQIQTNQSRTDAQGRVRQAEAELSSAEAELAQQEASLKLALFDRDAYTHLAATGAVSERQGRQDAAQGALTTARANLDNPTIRAAQEGMVRKQIAQQQAEIAAAVAALSRLALRSGRPRLTARTFSLLPRSMARSSRVRPNQAKLSPPELQSSRYWI